MNPSAQHAQQQGISYFEHLYFAMGIAWHLSSCVFAFAMHAVFPFTNIDATFDLDATTGFLQERNYWIENAKLKEQAEPSINTEDRETAVFYWLKKGTWFILFS